jgi:hypothetical protein
MAEGRLIILLQPVVFGARHSHMGGDASAYASPFERRPATVSSRRRGLNTSVVNVVGAQRLSPFFRNSKDFDTWVELGRLSSDLFDLAPAKRIP